MLVNNIKYLQDTFLIKKVERYDVKKKKYIQILILGFKCSF